MNLSISTMLFAGAICCSDPDNGRTFRGRLNAGDWTEEDHNPSGFQPGAWDFQAGMDNSTFITGDNATTPNPTVASP